MHTNGYSIPDFRFLDPAFPRDRIQIETELAATYHVPPEVICWFFEQIESYDEALELSRRK